MNKFKVLIKNEQDRDGILSYINFLANNAGFGYLKMEDYYYAGLEAIIKCEKYFDKSRKIKYSTFAKRVIFNEIASLINHSRRSMVLYNDHLEFAQDMKSYDPTNDYDAKILMVNLQPNFTSREKKVISYLVQGYKISEIEQQTNFSYKTVDNIMQSIKKKITNSPS